MRKIMRIIWVVAGLILRVFRQRVQDLGRAFRGGMEGVDERGTDRLAPRV